ncbi:hypothetical protein CTI14_63405, partial [Methylobacterium radiotolerans]
MPALPQTARAFWNRWKPAWLIKRGASRQRLTLDLHRAGGLWTLAAAIVLAVTGVYFNLGNLPALPQTARAFWNRWKPAWLIKRGASRQRLTL